MQNIDRGNSYMNILILKPLLLICNEILIINFILLDIFISTLIRGVSYSETVFRLSPEAELLIAC